VGLIIPTSQTNVEYLRIHIRADSNTQQAQSVKLLVRDKVVEYLTPIIAELDTKQKAQNRLTAELPNIEKVANTVLVQNGFDYTCSARINREQFPTRVYGDLTLEQGFYDALILELGSGKGDNWWCVVYPPLCFIGDGVVYKYKSKIYEIINDFLKKKQGE
jgi:stage II sporulation protein R